MPINSSSTPVVIVIGGGMAGMMSAFHVQQSLPRARVIVLEQGDHIPYDFGTSSRSAACSRQQWGLEHNVHMSLFSTRFYERFADIVGAKGKMFWQHGYLFLYRDAQKWVEAQRRVLDQQSWGLAEVRGLSARDVQREFPFAHTEQLLGGTYCSTDGFLDPGFIITALRNRLKADGAEIHTKTEVISFEMEGTSVTEVSVRQGDVVKHMPCDYVVNCTGPWAARIGTMLGTDLPVAPEKRYLWTAVFRDPSDDFPQSVYDKMPFTICNENGMVPYIKPQPTVGGNSFLVGCEHEVAPSWNFTPQDQDRVDPAFRVNVPDGYHQRVWEILADWLPFAERLGFNDRVHAGFYETTPTHSPVIGFDPNYPNVIHCAGFSGHGVMHGPAAGVTVADLLVHGEYRQFTEGAENLSYRSLMDGTRRMEGMKI